MGQGWGFMTPQSQHHGRIIASRLNDCVMINTVRDGQEFQFCVDKDNLWVLLGPLLELADEIEGNGSSNQDQHNGFPGQESLPF